jgi:hypothetical protein
MMASLLDRSLTDAWRNEAFAEDLRWLYASLPEHDTGNVIVWSWLVQRGVELIDLARFVHPLVVRRVVGFFGIRPGQAGVGMQPVLGHIPSGPAPGSVDLTGIQGQELVTRLRALAR